MQLNYFLTSFSAMEYLQKLQYDNTTCQPMPKRIPGEDYVKYIGKTVFCQRIFRLFLPFLHPNTDQKELFSDK